MMTNEQMNKMQARIGSISPMMRERIYFLCQSAGKVILEDAPILLEEVRQLQRQLDIKRLDRRPALEADSQ